MARHNTKTATPAKGQGPVRTTGEQVINANGGLGFARDAKSELFLATVTSLNEDNFYESADARLDRIESLLRKDSLFEDSEWLLGLVTWLRREVGLRSIPSALSAIAVKMRLDAGVHGGNVELVQSAIGRLDETADYLAYWTSTFGRKIPSAVKRGIANAFLDKLSERTFLKWRGRAAKGSVSLRDVVNLTHPKPKTDYQAALVKAVLDDAYGNELELGKLPVISNRIWWLGLPKDAQVHSLSDDSASYHIMEAALTHEVIAGALGVIPSEVWENLIPHMGYTALRMNLRRIAESGVSYDTIDQINKILADEENVARSKTMPINFLAAYKNAPLDFAGAIQRAANGTLKNIPSLPGRTLVLVDSSGSMYYDKLSAKSTLTRAEGARMFGVALALKAENADFYLYDNQLCHSEFKSKDLLRCVENLPDMGGGTNTAGAVRTAYNGHDRVVIVTDDQNGFYGDPGDEIPRYVPLYTWSLGGYAYGHTSSKPGRFTFGGLSDKGFDMIPLIEAGYNSGWPWEK